MLVPLDCSRLAESVLPYAVWLSNRFGLDITLFHACTPEICDFIEVHQDYINRKVEIIKRRLSQIREKKSDKLQDRVVEVRGICAIGYPAEEIINYSNENNISLILIARHGRSGVRQWAVGSVADKVLRVSRVPVWLIQVPFLEDTFEVCQPMKRILVLLDGSDIAESVLPHVEVLTKQQNSELTDVILLTAFDPATNSHFLNYGMVMDYLIEVEKRFKDTDLSVRYDIQEGSPARKIIDYANSNLATLDLIAMTTYGWSAPNGLGLGNVAEKVTLGVSVPILLVRPEEKIL